MHARWSSKQIKKHYDITRMLLWYHRWMGEFNGTIVTPEFIVNLYVLCSGDRFFSCQRGSKHRFCLWCMRKRRNWKGLISTWETILSTHVCCCLVGWIHRQQRAHLLRITRSKEFNPLTGCWEVKHDGKQLIFGSPLNTCDYAKWNVNSLVSNVVTFYTCMTSQGSFLHSWFVTHVASCHLRQKCK